MMLLVWSRSLCVFLLLLFAVALIKVTIVNFDILRLVVYANIWVINLLFFFDKDLLMPCRVLIFFFFLDTIRLIGFSE